MSRTSRFSVAFLLSVNLVVSVLRFSSRAQTGRSLLSAPEEIQAEFMKVPCKNGERLPAVRTLFERMGAGSADIVVQKGGNAENLVVTRAGTEAGTIVVGAHYDFVEPGCGAIDNWTGVVVVAHVFRSAAQLRLKKTVIYAAFGREEQGLVGSNAMARAIPKADVPQYCAMINIDSFGMGAPFALKNVSTDSLMKTTEQISAQMNVPFSAVEISDAGPDSSSFMAMKIPAITLSGLTNQWQSVLHSKADQVSGINSTSVYLGYRLTLSLLTEVDRNPCDAYRDKKSGK